MPSGRHSTDSATNLTHLLPAGEFIIFQTLAPIFTNNGDCGLIEKIITGIVLFLAIVICFCLSFTDSITTECGTVYYGLVTPSGLYNPKFRESGIPGELMHGDSYFTGGPDDDEYKLQITDFVNGFVSVVEFCVLCCLTPPVSTCYYGGISKTVVKTTPILVAIAVGVYSTIFPSARDGLGFAPATAGYGLVPENQRNAGARPPLSISNIIEASPNAERAADTPAADTPAASEKPDPNTEADGSLAINV